jgi:hypothetical protein
MEPHSTSKPSGSARLLGIVSAATIGGLAAGTQTIVATPTSLADVPGGHGFPVSRTRQGAIRLADADAVVRVLPLHEEG